MSTTLYCSDNDITDRLSAAGVTLRTDDNPPHPDRNAKHRASRRVDEFCLTRYTDTQLAASAIVNCWCADIAAVLECKGRGNSVPASLAEEYDHAIKQMVLVQKGYMNIADSAERRTNAPVMSNQRVVISPFPHVVTEPSISTGKVEDYRQIKDPYDGVAAAILDFVI